MVSKVTTTVQTTMPKKGNVRKKLDWRINAPISLKRYMEFEPNFITNAVSRKRRRSERPLLSKMSAPTNTPMTMPLLKVPSLPTCWIVKE